MAKTNIWFKQEGSRPEIIETADTKREAEYLMTEYAIAYDMHPGGRRHGKDKLWLGRRIDEPMVAPAKSKGENV